MTGKLFGLSIAALCFDCAKWYCFVTVIIEGILQVFTTLVTHPWLYYALLLAMSFAFFRLQTIFQKGANDEREALAKPQD